MRTRSSLETRLKPGVCPTGMEIEAKHQVLLKSLDAFYGQDAGAFSTFKEVVEGKTRMSLRVLDWLVTNYAKKRNIVYRTHVGDRDVTFNMFLEYKSQLKAYSKKFFDPFCRRGRVDFRGVKTTCGQLNFFKWAIQYGVLAYAREHHDAIEEDMLGSIQHRYAHATHAGAPLKADGAKDGARDGAKDGAKRKELSKAAIKTCTTTMVKVKVKFS